MEGWSANDWGILITAITGSLATTIGFLQWWLGRLDAREKSAKDAESNRVKQAKEEQDNIIKGIRDDFDRRYNALQDTVKAQGAMLALYVRHVRNLELALVAHDLEVPPFDIPEHLKEFWHGLP